ncbi:MAG: hypothetical protein ACTSW1_10900 [Candidatus Hodarchaeales archaeon]
MVITTKQKELLEKELKEIKIYYGIGFVISALIAGLIAFSVLRWVSGISLFGIEQFLGGTWTWLWTILIFLFAFLNWIRINRLTERKREIQMKLAEKVIE